MKTRFGILLMLITIVSGCGGGSGSSDTLDNSTVMTGRFIDNEVMNLRYVTETQSGYTNENGEYKYKPKEVVTFSIGELKFPTVTAKGIITPLTLAYTDNINDQQSVNISRLLLSLDVDGNPENGIEISSLAKSVAVKIDFDVSPNEFTNNTDVVNLVNNSGSINRQLITPLEAKEHLEKSISLQHFKNALAKASKGDILLFNKKHDCSGESCYFDAGAYALGEAYGYYSHAALITSISTDKKSVEVLHAASPNRSRENQVKVEELTFEGLREYYAKGLMSLFRVKNTTQKDRDKLTVSAIEKFENYTYISFYNFADLSRNDTYCSALVRDAYADYGYIIDDKDEFSGGRFMKFVFTPDELASSENLEILSSTIFAFDDEGTDLNNNDEVPLSKIVAEGRGNDRDALISPNGGEIWNNGDAQAIYWMTQYITGTSVDLYVLHDDPSGLFDKENQNIGSIINSKSWHGFAKSVPNTGSYTLDPSIMSGTGNAYMVLVVSTEDNSKFDISDETFSLNYQ